MPEVDEIEKEVRRRSLALEGAILMLIDGLAARGTISADEAEDMLSILAKSSETSSIRASNSLRTVRRLKQLRRGDGALTPGA
jgi:polyhydroxyalkanoate synthesis regulator phasin